MGIREATRQFRIQEWTKIIQDRMQSGLSVVEYCRQNKLSRDAYFYWAKIIKEQALKNLPEPRFVEMPAAVPAQGTPYALPGISSSSELAIEISGVKITVTDSTSPQLLARTLEVIRNAV